MLIYADTCTDGDTNASYQAQITREAFESFSRSNLSQGFGENFKVHYGGYLPSGAQAVHLNLLPGHGFRKGLGFADGSFWQLKCPL